MTADSMFVLSEEHRAIREAVRAVCDAKVAPYAAAVDEEVRYPQEAADALQAADFHAAHVPEEYGGAGADALATCIIIEEVARADVSASLIPAVNKLGSLPVQISGSTRRSRRSTSVRWRPARVGSPTACPSPTPAPTPWR